MDPLPLLDAELRERYRIERELGRGGMATVYLAHDLRHDRPVALKVLRAELAAGLGPERFLLEIRVTARLQHAHILPLLDSGVVEAAPGRPVPFYVMPFVEGESLRERLHRETQLPVDDAVRIAGDVARALAYAHARDVIHRDIKPENILLAGDQAIVADFGIARAASLAGAERLTSTGLAVGTPAYMSPEQAAADRDVDARADVYALGSVLYEMLAGEPPFTGPTAQVIAARLLTEPAPPVRRARPSVPEALERVIARALAKLPADRFATAADLGDALSRAAAASEPPPPSVPRARRRGTVGAVAGIALILCAAAAVLLRRPGSAGGIIAPASSMAVLPFTPSTTDTALSRLGRDLVFTLSAELDGLGGLRVVDAHTVLARSRSDEVSADAWPALARELGAGSLVQGSLVRVGPAVRLDLALVAAAGSATPLARVTVTTPPESVAALTDSAARALLLQIWSRGSPPTPSLDLALRTRSVPALRAFLQGEGELTRGQWDAAAASYQRAMDADPTFWLAYARHVFARYWSLYVPADSVVALLDRHSLELPERERLTTRAIVLQGRDSLARSLEQARLASERYPDSWFGWLIEGDGALHYGPILGRAMSDARTAFERASVLNPGLIPAWEHLMLPYLLEDDTPGVARALQALQRLDAGPTLSADGYGNRLLQYRFLSAIQRGDSAAADALTDSVARDPAPAAVPDGSFFDAFRFGWFARQIDVSRRALAHGGSPERRRTHALLLALSWGGRGAWDSALAVLDRSAAAGTDSTAAMRAYGLAALGAWLDALDLGEADARRSAAVGALGSAGGSAERAELAWLDGVVAAARRDRRGLARARDAVRGSGDSARAALDRSLGAMDAALRGATREAGTAMAALEWEEAALNERDFERHPMAMPLNRLAAARWLAASGDGEQALRLLRWSDAAFFLHPGTLYGLMLAGLAELERGRIEDRAGHSDLAAKHYRAFLQRYDRPVARHASLVEEAKARLAAAAH